MKQIPFYFTMLTLLLIWSCDNKQQSVSIDNLIVGKWEMVEYGSGYVNALDTLGFYKNGKADCPPETGEFTYYLIKPDSLIIYNRRQRIYADSIDELVSGEIEKYIRVTDR